MTTQIVENKCDGGQWTCSPPKECCKQGCCFLFSTSIYKGSPSNLQPGSVFNPPILRPLVTSKPDLYPLVISYNAEPVKNNNSSTGYLMVQYFRNFIVRPVGSLSATSTIDSLSSSFLCNAANEANMIIPPPYSHMGSLEEITTDTQLQTSQPTAEQRHLPRSASTSSNTEYHQVLLCHLMILGRLESKSQNNCDASAAISRVNRRIAKHKLSKEDSESQDEDHNFSDLLNLSVCMPSSVVQLENPIQSSPHLQELQYSVTNSIGSDISSLANLGSPDSPPRATSPTVEMKELLDKIQQLPQQKSPVPVMQQQTEIKNNRSYFHKVRAKTLYMPLCDSNSGAKSKNKPNVFPRSWLSRSAPCTPCGNFVPNFPLYHHKGSQRGSKTKITDGSPLLREQFEESEDEPNKDECL
ncbi:hypothetical protein NQ314_002834 [Rhamnusium bicolor]|uniref:Vesicular, overexpressed in cancer, prosurvival protein 1 n=1 Tax=Rhamnusium bicolor TaxID=1586634 RepID=A0AAV8ZPI2_9CUCU|nr:hypothetical protein NQ314_002834 [Rhamnusium bicolor]